jgi:hypothetical protein
MDLSTDVSNTIALKKKAHKTPFLRHQKYVVQYIHQVWGQLAQFRGTLDDQHNGRSKTVFFSCLF